MTTDLALITLNVVSMLALTSLHGASGYGLTCGAEVMTSSSDQRASDRPLTRG